MDKRRALRLEYGDRILFGYSHWGRCCTIAKFGRVRRVTPRGGILVDCLENDRITRTGQSEWVPYNHVFSVEPGAAAVTQSRRTTAPVPPDPVSKPVRVASPTALADAILAAIDAP
jgi:hypothetical protein